MSNVPGVIPSAAAEVSLTPAKRTRLDSCPSTPNFKKEWDKSDENYSENNVSVAVIDMDLVNELADNNGINDEEM
ncbi:hypothetical protein BB561_006866, partial [Smittium simulii]